MPSPTLDKVMHFFLLVSRNRRISVARIRKETGLSRSAVYRYIDAASAHLSIRREDGVIINDDFNHPENRPEHA